MNYDAVVFPGQGAQKAFMAQDFYDMFSEARTIFHLAKDTLKFDPISLCFSDDDKLHQTAYTQPCIVTAELAMYDAIKANTTFKPLYFAGHSLGEYTALATAGIISYDLTLKLVEKRGQLMQETRAAGGMVAVISPNIAIDKLEALITDLKVDIANDNSNAQVVLSGERLDLEKAMTIIENSFDKEELRLIPLNVSAPFHSRFMQEVAEEFKTFLLQFKADINTSNLDKVQSNYLGTFYQKDSDMLIDSLTKQLSGRVRWRDNMSSLLEKTEKIIEIGPQRPLKGFFKTFGVTTAAITQTRQISKVYP